MAHSKREIFIHTVWATRGRAPILRGSMERFVLRRIPEIADDLDLTVFAVNAAWDHLHVLTRWNTSVAISDAIREWKSRTSMEWNYSVHGKDKPLRWQRGAGVFSVSPEAVRTVQEYVFNQKLHHRDKTTVSDFEV